MKMSRRARRMDRHHRRHGRAGTLSLVSLMDIFTILVFFLLVSSAQVSPLPHRASIALPPSTAEAAPESGGVVIEVDRKSLRLQGREIVEIDDGLLADADALPALTEALVALGPTGGADGDGRLTVMGDGGIPYRLLQRILASCRRAGFPHIALAIRRQPRSRGR